MRHALAILGLWAGLLPAPVMADPIHDAARAGDEAAIIALLDAGADVNALRGYTTPLVNAVRKGHYAAAKLLIARGADVNAATDYWGEPLMMAAKQARADLLALLLANGAYANSIHRGEAALHVAAKLGCLDCVKELVKASADVNMPTLLIDGCIGGRTALHLARRYGFEVIAEYLEANGAAAVKPVSVVSRLAGASAEHGRILFEQDCSLCHTAEPPNDGMHLTSLWEIVGRAKASRSDQTYSQSLRDWSGTWTYEDLNIFLYGPALTVPGTTMETVGIADAGDRANVIVYLRSLSGDPLPLP